MKFLKSLFEKPYVITYIADGVRWRFKYKKEEPAQKNYEKLSRVLNKEHKGIVTLHKDGVLLRQFDGEQRYEGGQMV